MNETTKGRAAEAKRAIGTTLIQLDYATAEELAAITAAHERINRAIAQRANAAREKVVA